MKNKIIVQNQEVSIVRDNYISLTDIAKSKNKDEPKDVVKNWLRNKNTIEFLGLWERINNKNFKGVEFDSFKNEAGLNSFTLAQTKWIDKAGAIAQMIKQNISSEERLIKLNEIAIEQLQLLLKYTAKTGKLK